jgi:1-acyl-sn-glycerol-3-phosphate acyltransferase
MAYRTRVAGRGNVPARGAALLVCNHVSFVDWLFISAAVGRPVRFVMDYNYMRGPLKGLLALLGVIPIAGPREDPRILEQAYASIARALADGELVCIFPEGTITRSGKLSAFKPGVMKILKANPVPVVPMALEGLWGSIFSHEGGRPFRKWPRRFRARVGLTIGKPIESVTLEAVETAVRALVEA